MKNSLLFISSFWCLIKIFLTVSKFKTLGKILFSVQSLSIHVYLLLHICIVLEMFPYMLSRIVEPKRGWVEREIFFPLFCMWIHINFNCICSRGLLGIIWNWQRVYAEELWAQMKREIRNVVLLSIPMERTYGNKIYIQKQKS